MSTDDPRRRVVRPARPAAPPPAAARVRDPDATLIPAPDPSVFASQIAARGARRSRESGLFFRRTVIPILLTCGLILPTLALMWLGLDPESPLRLGAGNWLPIALVATGVVMLALAILNMLQVRHLLRRAGRTDPDPR